MLGHSCLGIVRAEEHSGLTNARFERCEQGLGDTGDAGERQLSFFKNASISLPAPLTVPSPPELHGVVAGRASPSVPSRQHEAKGGRSPTWGERIALTTTASGSSPGATSLGADYFRWWYVDDRTGKQRRSSHHMTAHEAFLRWKGATPDPLTRLHKAAGLNTNRERFVRKWICSETSLTKHPNANQDAILYQTP